MDALRAGAMIGVVFLHASISYMTIRIPDLAWHIQEASAVPFFDGFFLFIQGFVMPLFFILSGFFSEHVTQSVGPSGFLANRKKKILFPFLWGCLLLLPVIYFIWSYGWLMSGQCEFREIVRVNFSSPFLKKNLYGPAHLWYLEYLLIYSGIFFLWRTRRSLVAVPAFLFVPATALILFFGPSAMFNFKNSFVPEPMRLLHYAVFFYFGAWFYAFGQKSDRWVRLAPLCLVLSLVAFLVEMSCFLQQQPIVAGSIGSVGLAISTAFFTWFFIVGCLGLGFKFFNRPIKWIRYLSDASYWVYLIHLPLVGLAQAVLFQFHLSSVLKFLIVAVAAMVFSLSSYPIFVRGLGGVGFFKRKAVL